MFQYTANNNDSMMGRGGIMIDDKSTFAANHGNRKTNEFLEDYSDTQKCCVWGIFGGSSTSSKR